MIQSSCRLPIGSEGLQFIKKKEKCSCILTFNSLYRSSPGLIYTYRSRFCKTLSCILTFNSDRITKIKIKIKNVMNRKENNLIHPS